MSLTPEHLHVVLNHLPLIGLLAAIVPLAIGVFWKRRESLAIGSLLAVLFAAPIPVIMWSGEEAEERAEMGLIQPGFDTVGMELLHEHEENAELGSKVIYATLGFGLIGLVIMKLKPKWQYIAGGVTLAGCVLSVGASVWIAQSGGLIRHPEFRETEQAPAP
jgi:hypothetical protein